MDEMFKTKKKVEKLMQEETRHALAFAVGLDPAERLLWVTLSHWGAPRYWTPALILKMEKLGLSLQHFEAKEETVVMGVFKLL